jgi:hypothetical protein
MQNGFLGRKRGEKKTRRGDTYGCQERTLVLAALSDFPSHPFAWEEEEREVKGGWRVKFLTTIKCLNTNVLSPSFFFPKKDVVARE